MQTYVVCQARDTDKGVPCQGHKMNISEASGGCLIYAELRGMSVQKHQQVCS